MQSSAGGNAVGAFAAGWARYIFENIFTIIFYTFFYLYTLISMYLYSENYNVIDEIKCVNSTLLLFTTIFAFFF